jgi:anti-sigma factor RsiW
MNHIDVKAYAVGELSESDKRQAAAHVASCEACGEELAGLQVTLSSLATLRDEEVPRRIAFVSDKVFEPRWWQAMTQRMFSPAFASACVLAGAIVFHAFANQGPSDAAIQARIDQAVKNEMQDRMVLFEQKDRQFAQAYMTAVNLVRE